MTEPLSQYKRMADLAYASIETGFILTRISSDLTPVTSIYDATDARVSTATGLVHTGCSVCASMHKTAVGVSRYVTARTLH